MPPETPQHQATASELVRSVLLAVEQTDIQTIQLEAGAWKIRVVQSPGISRPIRSGGPSDSHEFVELSAPLAGIFYARSAPEQPSFVSTGDAITAGQTVGLIETMKLFNEVVSDVEGVIAQVLAADGDLVEKGQTLMRIMPDEGDASN